MIIFDRQREKYHVVGYKQFDTEEPLKARFVNNGVPINLVDYYIRFECYKPDGNIVIQDDGIIVKNICEIEMLLNEQITVISGNVKCHFTLVNKTNERQISTFTFDMNIQKSVIDIRGYSNSTITMAERLNKDIAIGIKLNEDLKSDISVGNQTKDELISKTNIANSAKNTLVEKTNIANTTINTMVEKTNIAISKNNLLNDTIIEGDECIQELNNSILDGDDTNVRLQSTLDSAKDSIGKINATGNKSLIIGASQFTNNQYTWMHNMNNDNLVVNVIDSVLNEPLSPDYKIIDKNNILIRNSAEHPNLKVILSASYYHGNSILGTTAEDFAGDSIGVGTGKVRLKDSNGVAKSPITDSDAVFMSDGSTRLTDKIESTDILLDQIRNGIPSYNIRNFATFNESNVKRGYGFNLYDGEIYSEGTEYNNAVIDKFIPVNPYSKYEILVYQAETIYIAEYSNGNYIGYTELSNGYRWVYDSRSNMIEYGSTSSYSSAFSYFVTRNYTDHIKICFKFSDYTTNPNYFPNSNTLMLDNAIKSLKIVEVSRGII